MFYKKRYKQAKNDLDTLKGVNTLSDRQIVKLQQEKSALKRKLKQLQTKIEQT